MMRLTRASIAIAISFAGVFPLNRAAAEDPDYFPAKEGLYWTYVGLDLGGSGESRPIVVRVSKVEKTTDGVRVHQQTSLDLEKWDDSEGFEITTKGVFRTHFKGKKLDSPTQQIKYPVKEGDSWSAKLNFQKKEITVKCTVGKREKLALKVGNFDAVPIIQETELNKETVISTIWYAAGTGMVKNSIRSGKQEIVIELRAFEEVKIRP